MSKVLKSIDDKITEIKKRILPKNFDHILELDKAMSKYMEKFVTKNPHELYLILSEKIKKNDDPEMKEILAIYTRLNRENIYDRLMYITVTLCDILNDLEKLKSSDANGIKSIKSIKGGGHVIIQYNSRLLNNFYAHDIDNVRIESEIYPNFLLDESNEFMLHRLSGVRHLINSPVIYQRGKDYINHINFITKMNLEYGRHKIYRYIDKRVLLNNINVIKKIMKSHHDFYSTFRVTIHELNSFCVQLMHDIGDNVIDIELLNYDAINNPDLGGLNYGILLLNNFKVLINSVLHN
jgi:hypothetical protein